MIEPRQYTTERGVTIGVIPIPLLLDEIRRAHPMPKRPTYTEHIAGGGRNVIEITEQMAANWQAHDPDTWAEYAETWAAYEAERDAVHEVLNERIWQAVLRRAIVVELPADDAWAEDQAEFGLDVPTDPKARRLHYLRTEVLGGMRDVLKLTAMANGADLSEEAISLAEASFRGSVVGRLAAGLSRQAAQKPADEIGAVARGNEGADDAGGESVGAAAE